MDIQVSPRSTGSVSVSAAVAQAHRLIESAGLPHMLHPMGTCIEGSPDELYDLAAKIHRALAKMDYPRISVYIKIDDRRDKKQTLGDKIARVKQRLEEETP